MTDEVEKMDGQEDGAEKPEIYSVKKGEKGFAYNRRDFLVTAAAGGVGSALVQLGIARARQGKTDEALALLAGSEKVMARLPLLGGGPKWDGRAPSDARALALRGRPSVPQIPGRELGLVSDDFFSLTTRPQRVAIVGSGAGGGMAAYMDMRALNRLLGEGDALSAFSLRLDRALDRAHGKDCGGLRRRPGSNLGPAALRWRSPRGLAS